jgi:hypothetical protein
VGHEDVAVECYCREAIKRAGDARTHNQEQSERFLAGL